MTDAAARYVEAIADVVADLPDEIERGVFPPGAYAAIASMLVVIGGALHAGNVLGVIGAATVAVGTTWLPIREDRRWRADE